jgi:hypothetical protein
MPQGILKSYRDAVIQQILSDGEIFVFKEDFTYDLTLSDYESTVAEVDAAGYTRPTFLAANFVTEADGSVSYPDIQVTVTEAGQQAFGYLIKFDETAFLLVKEDTPKDLSPANPYVIQITRLGIGTAEV